MTDLAPPTGPAPAEEVVLLAEDGSGVGTQDKALVHTRATPLHLAFSCHLFDDAGQVLVTRRALTKITWPGVWTNAFCGHPGPGEAMADALRRRGRHELGVEISEPVTVLPDFRYRAVDASGIVENEICPVHTARALTRPSPDPTEVAEHRWVRPEDLLAAVRAAPWAFSPWLVDQLADPRLTELFAPRSEGTPRRCEGTPPR